jgi:rSAM/selenodomain-associated transferase 2
LIKISVIVPALNEEKSLHRTLSNLNITDLEELIIVDGGSNDRTVLIASGFTDKVFVTHKGRGHQMNYGAQKANGNILLFLHADCLLPKEGFELIREKLNDKQVSAGAFFLNIDHPSFRFRIIEKVANLRSRITRIPYGDQGLFIRKELFEQIGGFADIPLMEDIEISRRLKKIAKIVFLRTPIKASPRRWLKEGLIYTTLRDWIVAILYIFLKVSPEKLMKHYKDVR